MTETPLASLWLELVGGMVEFPSDESGLDRSIVSTSYILSARWEAIFKLANPEQLVLPNGRDTKDMRIHLTLLSSIEVEEIADLELGESRGRLRLFPRSHPPLADGTLVLNPNALCAVAECIRTDRGKVLIQLWLSGMSVSLSQEINYWEADSHSPPTIEGFDLKVRYGEPPVRHDILD